MYHNLGKIETLIPRYGNIEGGNEDTLNIADDLDVSRDGSIYFSDIGVNTKYLADWVIDFIADPTGRLIKYNPETQETEVLLRRLRFANGVQLSASEDFVAVNELGMGRTWKYNLIYDTPFYDANKYVQNAQKFKVIICG